MDPYRDPARSVEDRVADLLARMTLDEKLAQLGGVWSFELLADGRFDPARARDLIPHGIGQVGRPAATTALGPEELAFFCNEAQRFLRESTRLGVPAIVHEECLSGFTARGATVFPQMIGLASTWEPELAARMTAVIRAQVRAAGVHQAFAPVLDVARDPRWGRVEETFGEDPFLAAAMGTAYVRGLQGPDIKSGVVATVKHFAAHGASEGGLNWAPAHVPPRELREVHLVPFRAAIREGGALAVMNAYHEIDGVPCAASGELLTRILREEWGFEGIVVSDYLAVDMLCTYHRVAADKGEAGRLALAAGIDQELPRYDCYGAPLRELVERGEVAMALVDRAVARVLQLKLRLGLFEQPYVQPGRAGGLFDLPDHRELALEIARKSMVLLKNEGGILPLDPSARLAVIGPNAADARNLLGDYTYPAQAEMLAMTAGVRDPGSSTPVVSILAGIRARAAAVHHARGCGVLGEDRSGLAGAVAAARDADAAVVVVGGKSGLTLDCTSGELRDRAVLGLPGVQEELVRAVAGTGTPVVLVLVNGRPYALEGLVGEVAAVLEAWLPGEEGGNAVADALFGDVNPGGKLPVSFPRVAGQVPVYYGHKPSGGRSQFWGDYVETSSRPLFPFGHGLSYARFAYSGLRIEPAQVTPGGAVTISVEVRNAGEVRGDEVVQLYLNDEVASVTRPVKELRGFCRLTLEPGERRPVTFQIAAADLAFPGPDLAPTLEPGVFRVMVGGSSADIALEGSFEVVAALTVGRERPG